MLGGKTNIRYLLYICSLYVTNSWNYLHQDERGFSQCSSDFFAQHVLFLPLPEEGKNAALPVCVTSHGVYKTKHVALSLLLFSVKADECHVFLVVRWLPRTEPLYRLPTQR
jgi:hypothetical protein